MMTKEKDRPGAVLYWLALAGAGQSLLTSVNLLIPSTFSSAFS